MSRPKSVPYLDELAAAWYDAAREGRLLIQRCAACERFQFYPRAHCVHCHGARVVWHEASGRGRLHTFSVVRYTPNEEFAGEVPYVFAIVELEEGVRVSAQLVGADADALACELPVRVAFQRRDDLVLPCFEPDGGPR